VLNERIEEFEKEKEELKQQMTEKAKETEKKLKIKCQNIIDKKQSEIARVNQELQLCQAKLKQS